MRAPKQGFTLLEVMVSVTILAVLTLMLTRVFSETLRAMERGRDRVLLDETARMVLDYFEEDFRQAQVRSDRSIESLPQAAGNGIAFVSPGGRRLSGNSALDLIPMRGAVRRG